MGVGLLIIYGAVVLTALVLWRILHAYRVSVTVGPRSPPSTLARQTPAPASPWRFATGDSPVALAADETSLGHICEFIATPLSSSGESKCFAVGLLLHSF